MSTRNQDSDGGLLDAPSAGTESGAGRAADRLFRHFADAIASGALREGDTLPPEREIVTEHGVSRTVVREAVQMLSNRGLVDARPRFRPVVRRPSADTAFDTVNVVVQHLLAQQGGLRNLFDTRVMVEVALARQAATDATRDDIRHMTDALAANTAAVADRHEFFRTDIAFHEVLYRVPRNPVLPALHRAYHGWLAPQWRKMPRNPERNLINAASHKAIYDAILLRDPDAAEAAMRKHLDDAWAQVRITFEETA